MTTSKKGSLLERWKNRKRKEKIKTSLIVFNNGKSAPLSFGQQRIWFLQQLYPQNPFYHYTEKFRFTGSLNRKVLIQSLELLAKRHTIFRTTFEIQNGKAIQKIHDSPKIEIHTHDLKEIKEGQRKSEIEFITKKNAETPFDLEKDALTRVVVIQVKKDETLLLICSHHIITDKNSISIFGRELGLIYQACLSNKLPDLLPQTAQYADFSHWQMTQETNESALNFWKQKLGGDLPILNLPTDFPRPSIPTFRGGHLSIPLPISLSDDLKQIAREAQSTAFVLLLATYKILLHKYTHQEDLLVGTPIINRDRKEFENVMGFFNNTVVLRSNLSQNDSFLDVVQQVRAATLEAFSHKNAPFESIVKALKSKRYASTNSVFQTMFLFNEMGTHPSFGKELEVEQGILNLGYSKFDLTLFIFDQGDHFSVQIEYAKDLFEPATIEQMLVHYKVLLENIAQNPRQAISNLSLLSDSERQLVLSEWNDTYTVISDLPNIHSQIEKQALETPDVIAVKFENRELTYRELNKNAEIVAAHLQKSGIQKNSIIGLCMEGSLELIIGMLGILKAGGTYLPLDPEYPPERIDFMTKDTNVPVILAQEHLVDNFFSSEARLLGIESILRTPIEDRKKIDVHKKDTAYVIYTSGSTGQPKGVEVTHQNLIHSTMSRFEYYPKSPGTFLLLSSFSFDSSVVGVFWTLCSGGTLVIPKHRIEQDLEELGDLIKNHQVTHTLLLPSLYNVLLQNIALEKLSSLNTVIVAGEACSSKVGKQHYTQFPEGVTLYNEYGPTEASVWCTVHRVTPSDSKKRIPIGKPIPNAQNYILDKNLQPVPIGIIGELYIGGDGIAKGYINRPELTKERFIPNPFGGSEKLYKTGDLARYRPDGIIEYLGREDNQVKIRGYRIELEEIKTVLQRFEGVQKVLVIMEKESNPSKIEVEETAYLTRQLLNLEPSQAEQLLASIESLSNDKIESILQATAIEQ